MTKRRWGNAGILTVILASGVALGVLLMGFAVRDTPPAALAEPTEPSQYPVVPQSYADPRLVQVQITTPEEIDIRAQSGGVVTRVDCTVTGVWQSGQSNLSIDGTPILNLHTSTPLWRDLEVGTRGADVDAFKEELRRLNQPASDGPELRWRDIVTYRTMTKAAGAPSDFQTVSPTTTLWIPAPSVSIAGCDAPLGSQITAGDVVAQSRSEIQVKIASDVIADSGARQLQLGEATVLLAPDMTLQNPAEASALTQTSVYRAATEQEDKTASVVEVEGTVSLIEPIQVAPLPPASIRATSQNSGCVQTANGTVEPITILSSELGRTLVVFESGDFPEMIAATGPPQCP